MYSKTLNVALSIGRYMSETDDIFENFIEYRVEAINLLKTNLPDLNISPQAKEKLFAALFVLQKSQNIFEYYCWQINMLSSNKFNLTPEKIRANINDHTQPIEKEITKVLNNANISIETINKHYEKILACIDIIATEIKNYGASSIDNNFIVSTFNIKTTNNFLKQ